jgi:arylsulfatase A-like enzyme
VRRLSWILALTASALAASPGAARTSVQAGAQQPLRPNLLLVTIDSLRADRATERIMPALTDLAARGTRFERAYAHAPLTLPSHTSILTGLLPPEHGVRNNGFRLDESVVTLAELLADAGYRTGAFVGASALDARFGLSQGFQEYDDRYDVPQPSGGTSTFRPGARLASAVLAQASAWIERQPEPWFVWAHLRDPLAAATVYEQAVSSADTALGDFLLSPARRDLLARTVIVVTADHGEGLGQHGERTHGVFAYEGTLRVPLVMAGPGVPQRVMSGPPVAHVDIAPTVLDLLGVGPRAFAGRTLKPAIEGGTLAARSIYFEALDPALMRGGAPLTGVIHGRWKYIDLPIPELYDLLADPAERQNRATTDAAAVTELRDLTIALRTRPARADAAGALAEPEARTRLRSLGYVGSASWRLGASRVEDDPKRLMPLHLAYESAIEMAGPDPDKAIAQLRSILEQRPDFAAAIDALGALLLARGKTKEALTLLTQARAGGLRHRVITERLSATLLAMKDARGAAALLQPVIEAEDGAVDARFLLARALAAQGNVSDAAAHLETALKLDPTFTAAADLLERLKKR